MAAYDDLNTPLLALAGILLTVLTFAAILGLQALYHHYQNAEFVAKVVSVPDMASDDLIAQQQARLNRYEVIDAAHGVVAIPIERAMELVVREMRQQQEDRGNNDET